MSSITVIANVAQDASVVDGTKTVVVIATAATGPAGGGAGSGLPSGGTVGQVVTNTGPGAGDWEDPAGSAAFEFDQDIGSALWTIVHGLGMFPNVTIVDTLGREFEGLITYVDDNTVTATFAVAVTGKAYLS